MDTLLYYLPFLETIRDFIELGGPGTPGHRFGDAVHVDADH